jgi:hypothetical protein
MARYPGLTSFIVTLTLYGAVGGCAGTVSREHVDTETVVDVEASDVDLRAMSREMAADIIELPYIRDSPHAIRMGFQKIENRTDTVDFDSYNLLSKIRQELIGHSQGKIVFLDEKVLEEVLAARDAKRAGQVTFSERLDRPGVDLILTGYAYSQRKNGNDGLIEAYHRYTFRLTHAETDEVKWEKDYEFKKLGRRGSAYQGR